VIVPAKVVLTHVTRRVPWGGVLVIRGGLLGGHIPYEQILQLRTGVGRHLQVIGNPYLRRDGRFVIRLAATGPGGPLRTQIAVTTLKETNYPYARGSSSRVGNDRVGPAGPAFAPPMSTQVRYLRAFSERMA
jgi:hypothetical protein